MEKQSNFSWSAIVGNGKQPEPVKPKTATFVVRGETTTATYQRKFNMNFPGSTTRVRARSVGLRHSTARTQVTMNAESGETISTTQLAPMVVYDSRQHRRDNGPWHPPTSNAPILNRRSTQRIAPGDIIDADINGNDHPIIGKRAL